MDFTLRTYKHLLRSLINQKISFQTVSNFLEKPESKIIILRHDVDKQPHNALSFARIEHEYGIRGTYYFRILQCSFIPAIIQEIQSLGHEIGYHYEDLDTTAQRVKGAKEEELIKIAIESFAENLDKLRKVVPVETICMHGSPLSRLDNRLLWEFYDYHDFGIIGEPYFDIDFNKVFYLTDTGRRWDGDTVSVRDKASGVRRQASGENPYKDWKVKPFKFRQITQDPAPRTPYRAPFPKFHSTSDIIKAAEEGRLPDKIMMTFHPQRWTDRVALWMKELIWQNVKNIGKFFLVKSIK